MSERRVKYHRMRLTISMIQRREGGGRAGSADTALRAVLRIGNGSENGRGPRYGDDAERRERRRGERWTRGASCRTRASDPTARLRRHKLTEQRAPAARKSSIPTWKTAPMSGAGAPHRRAHADDMRAPPCELAARQKSSEICSTKSSVSSTGDHEVLRCYLQRSIPSSRMQEMSHVAHRTEAAQRRCSAPRYARVALIAGRWTG